MDKILKKNECVRTNKSCLYRVQSYPALDIGKDPVVRLLIT